jgi:hypothetical protein
MGGAIDSPNSEQLGYLRRRRDFGEAPRARAKHPRLRWLSLGIALALVAMLVFLGAASILQSDREALASNAAGTWLQSGAVGSILVITGPRFDSDGREIAGPRFSGTVDGRPVRGAITAAAFPSLSRTVRLSLLGQFWDLRRQGPHRLTLTNSAGRVITFQGPV